MATNSNLERWLDGEALDESLADHDAKYHGGHFDPETMSCGKRDTMAKEDSDDMSLSQIRNSDSPDDDAESKKRSKIAKKEDEIRKTSAYQAFAKRKSDEEKRKAVAEWYYENKDRAKRIGIRPLALLFDEVFETAYKDVKLTPDDAMDMYKYLAEARDS